MTRVLVIESSGNLWGSERSLLGLLNTMPTLEVAVCCPPAMPLNVELEKLRIRMLPYFIFGLHKKSRWQRLLAALGVLRACLIFRPDVIYLNQSGAYRVILTAATLLNLPIVAHVRIFEDVAYLARQNPNPRRLRGLIAISLAVEEEIGRFRELDTIRLHRMYDAYAPTAQSLPPFSADQIVNRIACVARVVPIKGHDVLVAALGLLKDAGCNVDCLMVGDGERSFTQELRKLANKLNAASSIRWSGFVNDIIPLLRTCSVLVCPSHREPLGRVILEAWDAGVVPVVFAGSGGAAEIVTAADGGIVYTEQEPESLAGALRVALELNHEQRTRLVRNGRMWMSKNCDPEPYGEALSSIFTSASVYNTNSVEVP